MHEEKTGEFARNNIIHVNFFGPRRTAEPEAKLRDEKTTGTVARLNRRRPWALGAPWILRLAMLLGILVLSLLVL